MRRARSRRPGGGQLTQVEQRPGQVVLLSALVAVREDDDRLSENELTSMGFLLLAPARR